VRTAEDEFSRLVTSEDLKSLDERVRPLDKVGGMKVEGFISFKKSFFLDTFFCSNNNL
jgi:hypothetical protein